MKMYGNYKNNPLPLLIVPIALGGLVAVVGVPLLIRSFTERRIRRGSLGTAVGAAAGTISGAVYGARMNRSPVLMASAGGIIGGVVGALTDRALRSDEEKEAEQRLLDALRDPAKAGEEFVEGATDAGGRLISESYESGKEVGESALEGAWNVVTAPYDWIMGND